jgi:hypothetical protein
MKSVIIWHYTFRVAMYENYGDMSKFCMNLKLDWDALMLHPKDFGGLVFYISPFLLFYICATQSPRF